MATRGQREVLVMRLFCVLAVVVVTQIYMWENGEELVHTRRSALKTGEPEKSQWITSKSVMQDVITGEKWRIYRILQMHVNLQIFQNAKFFKTSLLSVYSVLTREQALPCLTGILWKRVCKGIHLYSKA